MTDREERVQHDPVHAVITARQQIPVPFGEVISHALTVEATRPLDQDISTLPRRGHSFRAKSRTEIRDL